MEEKRLTYREYAAFAHQTAAEVARDCEVGVFRATGPGGQGVNTTDSAVRMRHVPTGIVVTGAKAAASFKIEPRASASFRRSFVVAPCRPRCAT